MVRPKETNPDRTMSSEDELSYKFSAEMHVLHDGDENIDCHYQYQDYHLKSKILDQEYSQTYDILF